MTQIHGQIESLKHIREILDQNGITRFNSTGQINAFLKNYDLEKELLVFNTERQLDSELEVLRTKTYYIIKDLREIKVRTKTNITNKISQLKAKSETLSLPAKNAVLEILHWYQQQLCLAYSFLLEHNLGTILWFRIYAAKKQLKFNQNKIRNYRNNRQELISERCAPKFKELEHIKTVADDLYPLIAGAIGESMVAKELEMLPEECVLFNDFSLKLKTPIYNRRENDLIRSIQIDHLLITRAGVFVIETKNWSQASLERFDLRSPIKQIQRVSYALFVLLNPKERTLTRLLKKHHWGNKKLPIRNIVAMIHHRPKEKFNYVAVKKLHELNNYIGHFEPLFDSSEVRNIADHLKKLHDS